MRGPSLNEDTLHPVLAELPVFAKISIPTRPVESLTPAATSVALSSAARAA